MYFLAGFDFDGYIGISEDGIDFVSCMGVPVGEGIFVVVIAEVGDDFLYYQMFKSMAEVITSWLHVAAV